MTPDDDERMTICHRCAGVGCEFCEGEGEVLEPLGLGEEKFEL